MKLGIDVQTLGKAKTIARLNRLSAVTSAIDGGVYSQDQNVSQILVDTSWNEQQLEMWLYNTKGIDYLGTFTVDAKLAVA